jgi:hypothetical protein
LAIGLHARLAVGLGTKGTSEKATVGHARALLRETRHTTSGHLWHPALNAILKASGDIVGQKARKPTVKNDSIDGLPFVAQKLEVVRGALRYG